MNEKDRSKKLDELLDAALASYGAAEPLRGIEERVLNRLRGEEARRPWWMWSAVAAAAAAAVVAVVKIGRASCRERV